MYSHISHKQAARVLVESYRTTQNPRHQRTQAGQRHEAAAVLQQKIRGKIKVAAMNTCTSLSGGELTFYVVVAKLPVISIRFSADSAQRFEKFEQANIFIAITIQDRKAVVGSVGIDRNVFLFRGTIKQKRRGQKNRGTESHKRLCGKRMSPRQPAAGRPPQRNDLLQRINCQSTKQLRIEVGGLLR